MSKDIRIKRGLSLQLKGEAEKQLVEAPRSRTYAIKPPDFHSVVPKMVVKEGDRVLAGDEIFFSKYDPRHFSFLEIRIKILQFLFLKIILRILLAFGVKYSDLFG